MKRLCGLVLLIALLAIGVSTWAATITVPDDYPTIQAAIDAAQPGDTVYIEAGRYIENIVIDKPLHLVGEDRTKVVIQSPDERKDVITVLFSSGEVCITSIETCMGDIGILLSLPSGTKASVTNAISYENVVGIDIVGEGEFSLSESFLIDNKAAGLSLRNGVATVDGNEILLGGIGVVLVGSVDATLDNNLIGLCALGIETYTTGCGWANGEESFSGTVAGTRNRVHSLNTDLCPGYLAGSWPDGFIDAEWTEAIQPAVSAYNRGVNLYNDQDYKGAVAAYTTGLALLNGTSFPPLKAYLNSNIGNVYEKLGRYEDALNAYRSAWVVCISHNMEINVAKIDQNIGIVYWDLGRYEDALVAYQSARAEFTSHGMDVDVAGIDQNIGAVYCKLGWYEDALAAYGSAREVYESHNMEINVAEIDQNIGTVYWGLGRYQDALAVYQSAQAVYESHNMEINVAEIDQNIGNVYLNLGRYEDALKAYQSARAVYASHGMAVDVANIDQNIGVVYEGLGRYEDALAAYQSARAVYASHNMEVDVANIDTDIGVVYEDLGGYEDALVAYQLARTVYERQNMEVDVAKIDQGLGVVYSDLGQYEDALAAYQSARAVFASYNMGANVATIDMNIGNVYMGLGQYEDALASYQEAISILDRVSPAAGMTYSYPATRWMIYNNMGIAHEGLQKWDAAVKAYQDSVAVIESLRGYMKSEELKTAWQERTQDVYERLIKLLIGHGQGSAAFLYAERCRARTFLDALYQGSIKPDQLISPEAGISSGAVDAAVIDAAIKDGQGDLQPNEAVLEYFVTDDGVYLWVITEEGINDPIFIDYPRDQLMNDVIALREALERKPPDQITVSELLSSFYAKLVQPGLSELPDGVNTLVFIPSGPLWYLPFSALQMTDQEKVPNVSSGTRFPYLVEHYTIAYLPSLASLPSLVKEGAQTPSVTMQPLLALADPEVSENQLREGASSKCIIKPLPRYPGLVEAAQEFADELVGAGKEERCVYAGAEAQEVRAYDDAGSQVLVYAAHGQFNPYVPLQSKLLLAPGGEATRVQSDSRVSDGNYHAWEALLTDHRGTELVVLAACESLLPHLGEMEGALATLGNKECDQVKLSSKQLKQIVVGDEVVGLARAFLSSGAESVLGTLWLANPTAIGKLLVSMAKYHREGNTWAQALTKAQSDLIKNSTFNNPWFWAPYQLIGRWR